MEECNQDRISELPTSIIHDIMSLLERKDVVRLSTLSKTWREFYELFPCLEFREGYFSVFDETPEPTENEKASSVTLYRKLVDDALNRFHEQGICVTSFILEMKLLMDNDVARLDAWIEMFLMKLNGDYKELHLALSSWSPYVWPDYYVPCKVIFASKSITKLSISSCRVQLLQSVGTILEQCPLRELYLDSVQIDGQSLSNLKYYCPLLELISITNCYGFSCRSQEVSGHNRLKTLIINQSSCTYRDSNIRDITIEAPELELLHLRLSRECDTNLYFIVSSNDNLKNIILEGVVMEDVFFENTLPRFSKLEQLSLITCRVIYTTQKEEILISSPSLRKIEIQNDYIRLSKMKFDTPKLSSFTYDTEYMTQFSSVHSVATVDWAVTVRCEYTDKSWFRVLLTLVGSSNLFRVLNVNVRHSLEMQGRIRVSVPNPYQLDILRVAMEISPLTRRGEVAKFLDGLLCNFRPRHFSFKLTVDNYFSNCDLDTSIAEI